MGKLVLNTSKERDRFKNRLNTHPHRTISILPVDSSSRALSIHQPALHHSHINLPRPACRLERMEPRPRMYLTSRNNLQDSKPLHKPHRQFRRLLGAYQRLLGFLRVHLSQLLQSMLSRCSNCIMGSIHLNHQELHRILRRYLPRRMELHKQVRILPINHWRLRWMI